MNWKELWMTLFGTTEWLGLNIGFWVALAAVLLIVILMNVLFWSMKPKTDTKNCTNKKEASIGYSCLINSLILQYKIFGFLYIYQVDYIFFVCVSHYFANLH